MLLKWNKSKYLLEKTSSTLIDRPLNSGCVHKLERAFIFFMVVGIILLSSKRRIVFSWKVRISEDFSTVFELRLQILVCIYSLLFTLNQITTITYQGIAYLDKWHQSSLKPEKNKEKKNPNALHTLLTDTSFKQILSQNSVQLLSSQVTNSNSSQTGYNQIRQCYL